MEFSKFSKEDKQNLFWGEGSYLLFIILLYIEKTFVVCMYRDQCNTWESLDHQLCGSIYLKFVLLKPCLYLDSTSDQVYRITPDSDGTVDD